VHFSIRITTAITLKNPDSHRPKIKKKRTYNFRRLYNNCDTLSSDSTLTMVRSTKSPSMLGGRTQRKHETRDEQKDTKEEVVS
jgi:hypothetical protein